MEELIKEFSYRPRWVGALVWAGLFALGGFAVMGSTHGSDRWLSIGLFAVAALCVGWRAWEVSAVSGRHIRLFPHDMEIPQIGPQARRIPWSCMTGITTKSTRGLVESMNIQVLHGSVPDATVELQWVGNLAAWEELQWWIAHAMRRGGLSPASAGEIAREIEEAGANRKKGLVDGQ